MAAMATPGMARKPLKPNMVPRTASAVPPRQCAYSNTGGPGMLTAPRIAPESSPAPTSKSRRSGLRGCPTLPCTSPASAEASTAIPTQSRSRSSSASVSSQTPNGIPAIPAMAMREVLA